MLSFLFRLTLLLASIGASLYWLMNSPTYQIAGTLVNRVETDQPVVALTFDDGPNVFASDILATLDEHEVKATFYLIGQEMEDYPYETNQIVQAGHEIGNHSYSHQRLVLKPMDFIRQEIEFTEEIIREAGYTGEITFRPPYGKKFIMLPLYLNNNAITTITWDVEPTKALGPDANSAEITAYVLENAKPGSIILLHPWANLENPSREAIDDIIAGLKEQGMEFATISELIKF